MHEKYDKKDEVARKILLQSSGYAERKYHPDSVALDSVFRIRHEMQKIFVMDANQAPTVISLFNIVML